jgi:hypothetical protein
LFRAQELLAKNLVEQSGVRNLARDEKASRMNRPCRRRIRLGNQATSTKQDHNRWAAKESLRRVRRLDDFSLKQPSRWAGFGSFDTARGAGRRWTANHGPKLCGERWHHS